MKVQSTIYISYTSKKKSEEEVEQTEIFAGFVLGVDDALKKSRMEWSM